MGTSTKAAVSDRSIQTAMDRNDQERRYVDAEPVDPDATTPTAPSTATDRLLDLVWRSHRQWSLAADAARARLDRWRLWNLLLLVLGALAGAVAAQTWLAKGAAMGCAIVAAVVLAVAGFIQTNALNADQTARWTRARAASEALKAETYRFLIRVAPYADTNRAQVLQGQLDAIQTRAEALLVDQQTTPSDNRPPPTLNTVQEYVTDRAQNQADWHRRKIAEHAQRARNLRIWQLVATGAGVVLSAITGFVPSWRLSTWTAAATTVAAAFAAHLAATQHQHIAAAYAATTDQLDRLIAGIDPITATPDQQAQFVVDVERVLAIQNEGWTDLLSPKTAAKKTAAPTTT